jgi:hypothetical protein
MPEKEPVLTFSPLNQKVAVDGHVFEINIVSSDQYPEWILEVVDEFGMSHVWGAEFETDTEAFAAAMIAFDEEGAAGFLQPETNVVPFPSK